MDKYVFPQGGRQVQTSIYAPTYGLTKRELFAALAMQGLIAGAINSGKHTTEEYVENAVEFADALLAELAKEKA